MDDRKALETKLGRINTRIDEAEARLGAHSIKPILMQQLFELEEERAVILEQLDRLKKACPESPS